MHDAMALFPTIGDEDLFCFNELSAKGWGQLDHGVVSVWLHRSALLMTIGVNEASACVNIFFATLICLKRMAKLG